MQLTKLNMALALVAGSLPLSVFAAQTTEQLAEVIVTGTLYEQPLDKTLTNVSIINRSDLDKNHAYDLKSSIRYEPGVTVNSDITRYGNSGYNIRGIEGNRIVVMVDGVRMNDGYTQAGHNSANAVTRGGIEFDTIRQVDVVKGPYSALHGNDALGGAVNFNTWQPSDFVSAEKPYHIGFKQSYNSPNSGRASTLSAAGKAGVVSGLVMLTKRDSKETKNTGSVGGIGNDRTKPNPLDFDAYNILSKVTIGDGAHQVSLSGEYFDQERKINLMTSKGPVAFRGIVLSQIIDAKAHDKLKRHRLGAQYRYSVDEGIIRGFSASYAYHKTKAENISNKFSFSPARPPMMGMPARPATTPVWERTVFSYNQTSHQVHTQMNAFIDQGFMSHNIVTGLGYRVQILDPYDNLMGMGPKTSPKSQQDNIDVYVLDEMEFKNGFTLSPTLRYTNYSLKPKHDAEYSRTNPNVAVANKKISDSKVSPSLSFKLPIGDNDTAFLALSTGFKSPPIQAMNSYTFGHGPNQIIYVPNQNLKSETSKSAELGWRHHDDNWQAKISTYYNKYNNFIDKHRVGRDPVLGGLVYTYVNKHKVKTYGIEMATAYRFDNHITLSSGLSWMKGKEDDKKLDSAQPPKLTLGVGYEKEQWGVNADLTLVRAISFDRIDSSGTNSIRTPGYGATDLTVYWNVHKNVKLTAGVYNVFDKTYWHASDIKFDSDNTNRPHTLYSQPGRSFVATVKVDF